MIVGAALVVIGVGVLLYAEKTGRCALRWLGKPLGSAGFVLAAVGFPHLRLPHGTGWLLLAALLLAAAGDVLLVPKKRVWLTAGMGAFALAHVLLGAWFLTHDAPLPVLAVSAAVLLAAGHAAWLWVGPHVAERERVQVRAYMLLVSLMAAAAVAVLASGPLVMDAARRAAVGGALVYLSDLAVARQRFVRAAFVNRAWGLPVYYFGQLLIASAVLAA